MKNREGCQPKGDLVLHSFPMRGIGKGCAELVFLGSNDGMHGNGSKLCQGGLGGN